MEINQNDLIKQIDKVKELVKQKAKDFPEEWLRDIYFNLQNIEEDLKNDGNEPKEYKCIKCGDTNRLYHHAHGMCRKCYGKWYQNKKGVDKNGKNK